MGNSLKKDGFNNLPCLYLRDLRRKTRRRFKSIVTTQKTDLGIKKSKIPDEKAVTELNSKSVAEYAISNPNFLDELVRSHISQDRIRAWIKEPTYDDGDIMEVVDYEGNVEVSAQEEAEKEEEEIYKSSSSATKKKAKSESSSKGETSGETSNDPISKKFSKKILQMVSGIVEDKESEDKSEKKASEDDSVPAVNETSSQQSEEKYRKKPRNERKSMQEQQDQDRFRQRNILIITRSQLLYPEVHKHQEFKALQEAPDMSRKCRELESPLFPYTEIQYEDINKVFIMMCKDLLGENGFPWNEMCYFLTTLKANYQNVEYHNYSHALSHAQSMYWILKKTPGVFTELEMKALMIASISHDVGHPGLNETYLKKVRCTLAIMYSDPIVEEHHIQTLFLILQDIRCNIFCNLDSDNYRQVLDDIKLTILATNLQKYKGQCEKMRHIVETGVDFRKKHVKNALKALMMMACDMCSSWKRWDEHKNIVWSVYKEYFNQGDKEASFSITTPDHMLRTNAENIPKYQTSFMENVVMPILQILTRIFPPLKEVMKTTQDNLECWKTYH